MPDRGSGRRRVSWLVAPAATLLILTGCTPSPGGTYAAATGPTVAASPAPTRTDTTSAPSPAARVDCRKTRCVALTFDDGPGPYTRRLLGYLHAAGVPATFFMVGEQVAARPSVARAVAAAGNEIGVHTWDHPDLTRLTPARVARELTSTISAIRKDAGVRSHLLRPPYGALDAKVKKAARLAGLAVVLWSVDTLDWKTRSTAKTVKAAVRGARRGSIILIHDIHPWSVAAVPSIIAGLHKRGYTLVTVSDLLGTTTPGKVYSRG